MICAALSGLYFDSASAPNWPALSGKSKVVEPRLIQENNVGMVSQLLQKPKKQSFFGYRYLILVESSATLPNTDIFRVSLNNRNNSR